MARTSAKAKKLKQAGNNTKTEKVEEATSESNQDAVKTVDQRDADGSTDKENDDVNYEVEKIVHTRVYRGKRQYLVRWKGYGEDSDTWENESAVQSCPEALETFKNENSTLVDKSKNDSDNDGNDEEIEETKKKETKTKKKGSKNAKNGTSKTKKPTAKKSTNESEEVKNSGDEMEVDTVDREKKDSKKASKKNKGRGGKESEEPSRKKTKSNESDEESTTDGKNYEVEKIIEVHTRKDKTREFLIRWKGYRPSEDTWEPEAHLDCQDMIEKFMEKVDKAKNIPARELRESKTPAKFVSHNRSGRGNLRNSGVRPCYQE